MKLKQKITLVVVLLCVTPLLLSAILTNLIASNEANSALKQLSEERLISLRDVQKRQIENYFANMQNQLLNLAKSEFVSTALLDLSRSSQSFAAESGQMNSATINKQLRSFYETKFATRYQQKNDGQATVSPTQLLSKLDLNAQALQNSYIVSNSAPLGEKDSMLDPHDGSEYSYYHSKYHPYLRDFQQRFGFYDIFLVDAETGMIVYTVFKEIDFATSLKNGAYANTGIGQAYAKAMAAEDKDFVAAADFAPYMPSYNDPASFIATPIVINGIKKGVLIFQMPVDRINQIMTFNGNWTEAGLGNSGETYLIGPDNRSRSESRFLVEDKPGYINALEHSSTIDQETTRLIAAKSTAIGLQPVDSKGAQAALAGQSGFDVFPDYRGVNVLSAYAPLAINGLNWAILAEIDEDEAFAAAEKLSQSLWKYGLIILLVMAGLAAIVAIKFSDLIAKPILQISSFIANVAANLDLTPRLQMKREDEIGEAATTLNNLLQTFQRAMNEVTDASNQIAAASEETSVVTEQTNQAVQSQQSETTQVASAMNEMTATVNEVARNTTHTSAATDEAAEHVHSGLQAMEDTISLIQQLASIIEHTSDTISALEQRSIDISSVLDVINSVAEQTNLLALNAAIEAARAGEHGRGFAVVADEVRTLASRTQESTGEITRMIEQLQQGTKDAVSSMQQSQSQVGDAVTQAASTGEALQVIAEVISRINDMSTQIATAAEEQGAVAEEINRNIFRINDMSSQTAEGAAQTSQASRDLAQLAAGLSKIVQQFKV